MAVDLCSSYEAILHGQVEEEEEVLMRDGGQQSANIKKAETHRIINETVKNQMTLIHTLLEPL